VPRVFLSYRRDDTGELAMRLARRLKQDLGVDGAFLDSQDLEAGVEWRERLDEQIRACAAVIALIGHRWGGACSPIVTALRSRRWAFTKKPLPAIRYGS
jgi:hypothetical protein